MRNWETGIDWSQWQGSAHATVVDVDGDKIGKLDEIHAAEGYLRMKHGWLHRQDWYIPLGAVSRIDDHHQIVLRYTKAELDHQLWANPPRMEPSATTFADTQVARPVATNMAQEQAQIVGTPAPETRAAAVTAAAEDSAAQAAPATAVPVREEELVPRKEWHEEGVVHVHKDVVEEPATVSAQVVHEAVRVEHLAPADDEAANDEHAFQEENFDMPVLGQELVAEKRTKVSDEVRLQKTPIVTNEEVTGTVRRERISLSDANSDIVPPDDTQLSDQSAQW